MLQSLGVRLWHDIWHPIPKPGDGVVFISMARERLCVSPPVTDLRHDELLRIGEFAGWAVLLDIVTSRGRQSPWWPPPGGSDNAAARQNPEAATITQRRVYAFLRFHTCFCVFLRFSVFVPWFPMLFYVLYVFLCVLELFYVFHCFPMMLVAFLRVSYDVLWVCYR